MKWVRSSLRDNGDGALKPCLPFPVQSQLYTVPTMDTSQYPMQQTQKRKAREEIKCNREAYEKSTNWPCHFELSGAIFMPHASLFAPGVQGTRP